MNRRSTVYIAGDSTAATKAAAVAPETGWGQALPLFLAGHVAVANHAVNSRSSRSFVAEGRLAAILEAIRPGDVLLAQFGHNDQKTDERRTDPFTTYQRYLRRYVDGARERGARPVLLTPVERRGFGPEGRAVASHGDYPKAARELAESEGVPLVDVQAASLALWDRLGPEGSKRAFVWTEPGEWPGRPEGTRDDTHLCRYGAIEVARVVARAAARWPRHPGSGGAACDHRLSRDPAAVKAAVLAAAGYSGAGVVHRAEMGRQVSPSPKLSDSVPQ
jgi:lysophospholipase L1-like esterase